MAKYVCLFSFGNYHKGDPFTSSDPRTIQKLKANGMITETIAENAQKELEELEKKPVTLSSGNALKSGSVLQAGQASPSETASESKTSKRKRKSKGKESE